MGSDWEFRLYDRLWKLGSPMMMDLETAHERLDAFDAGVIDYIERHTRVDGAP